MAVGAGVGGGSAVVFARRLCGHARRKGRRQHTLAGPVGRTLRDVIGRQ
jgi:hypothetical protein